MVSRTSIVSRKNSMVINFARSCSQSRVSIDFSCTISKIQNTGHSRRISMVIAHGKSYEHGFPKKLNSHKRCVM
ncbi:hypothetical protein B296_00056297 [Ensete ventricosum]|uniref:Uncharacterized protein n=1 Tax=Ensete ventricosum TaxID=4639 RepID=A0A426XA18_ENSVE|nr:hypothetical protein B296_00056297 [Ensete ventricosum]